MAFVETASEAKFTIELGGDHDLFKIVSFEGTEEISRPFHFSLELAMEGSESDDFIFSALLGEEACLRISGRGDDRYVHGIVSEIECLGERGKFVIYRMSLVPSLWLLSLRNDCRIFQKKKVTEIIKDVLTEAGIPNDRFRFALTNNYLTREYCVQYNESDLDFISRLMEEEGIFYFFEHKKDSHILVMADQNIAHKPISEDDYEIPYHPPDALVPEEESVFNFRFSGRITKGKVTLKDFNFKKPGLDLKASKTAELYKKLEHYEYPGEYTEKKEGERRADIRLKAATVFQDKGNGRSFCPRFVPGFTFRLKGHPRSTLDEAEYTLVSVVHKGKQPQVLEEFTPFEEHDYYNIFTCIYKDTVFKPERVTPKPIVPGTQTAIVVGPKGEESYLDDEHYGMVKVQFHWDRKGKRDEHSSCWIRVAYPYAGEKHGMQFTPLVGDEVLVDFLEGDPDRPVIVGSLFKGDHKALVKGEEMTKNMFLTPYGHTLVFNDKEKGIALATKEGRELMMVDDGDPVGNLVFLATPKNQSFMMDDNKQTVSITDAKGNTIVLGPNKPNIYISDSSSKHTIQIGPGSIEIIADTGTMTLQTKGGTLTVKAAGQKLLLEGAGGNIVIDSKGITVNAGSKPVEVVGSIIKLNS